MKELFVNIFYRIYATFILYADSSIDAVERTVIAAKLLFIIAPFVYALNQFNHWFETNHQFVSFMIYAIFANMMAGWWAHKKRGTFDWKEFWVKNSEIFAITIMVYFLLDILNEVAGRSITGNVFQITIQVLTILFPISKAFKSIHFITNGKMPPTFIMKRLYKFDETGDINELFKTPENERKNENEFED